MVMLFPFILLVVIISSLINVIKFIFIQYQTYRCLEKIPGPEFRFSLLGNLNLLYDIVLSRTDRPNNEFFNLINKLSDQYDTKKYGLFRLWLGPFIPIVVITNANIAQKVLNSENHLDKATCYRLVRFVIFDGILTCNTERWRHQKRELQIYLKFKALHTYLPNTERNLSILNEQIEKCIRENHGVFKDIKPIISTFVLDVLGENFFSTEFRSLSTGIEPKFIQTIEQLMDLGFVNMVKPWTYFFRNQFLNSFICLMSISLENIKSLFLILEFQNAIRKIIMNRLKRLRQDDQCKTDLMLDSLIQVRTNQHSKVLNIREIETHMNFFIIGGHDTTTSSLSWMLYLLGHHIEVQQRLREEIDQYLNDLESNNEQITLFNMKRLKYLNCCIFESLRLYPSAPIIGRRGKSAIILENEIILPPHTNYIIFIHKMLRNPDYFKEPDKFHPERFMKNKDNSENWIDHSAYLPFSSGIRMCLGKEYALMQLRMFFINLIGKYLVKSLDQYGDCQSKLNVLHSPAHFPVQFQRR